MKEFIRKLNDLKSYYKKEEYGHIGGNLNIPENIRYNLLKKGWWSVYYFASSYKTNYGLHITSDSKFDRWPVISTFDYDSTTTLAPNIGLFYFFRYLKNLDDVEVFDEYINENEKIKKIAIPFLEAVNGAKEFNYFNEYFTNTLNRPDSDEKILDNYLHFWNRYDNSYGHQILRKIISDFNEDKVIDFNEIAFDKLGHWKSRVLYILVYYVNKKEISIKNNLNVEKLLWELFSSINIFDCEEVNIKNFPNKIETPISAIWYCVNELGTDIEKRSDYIKNSPLFPALVKMSDIYRNNFNLRSYTGVEHVEAAAYYDSELNDPVMSWNCLVNGAYWSGVNTNETLLPAWEAAIYLAKKHGWDDVYTALNEQYEFYKDFKLQNSLN